MEKPWWPHGRPDHQRGASDAPRGFPRGPQAGSVEGDLGLWRCVRPEGDSLWTQPRQTGERLKVWLLCSCCFFDSIKVVMFLFGLILSVCLCVNLCRRRVRAVRFVTVPWSTCVVPRCCGVQVKGWCVHPRCVTWKPFARSSTRPGLSVL